MPKSRAGAARVTDAASFFAALGDPARLQIVNRLCQEGPLSIVRLTAGSRISRQAITKHLNALSAAGLVESERNGRECVWELQTQRIAEVQHYLAQISDQWDDALDRLRLYVEKEEH